MPGGARLAYRTGEINLELELIKNEEKLEQVIDTDPSRVFSRSELLSDPYTEITIRAIILGIKSEDPRATKLNINGVADISVGSVGDFFDCEFQQVEPQKTYGEDKAVLTPISDLGCKFNKERFESSNLVQLNEGDVFSLTVTLFSLDEDFTKYKIEGVLESLH